MKPKTSASQLFLVVVSAAILSILTIFLAAPLLRLLLSAYGSKKYWLAGLVVVGSLVVVGLTPVAFGPAALWITVGLYGEIEYFGYSGIASGMAALIVGTLAWMGGACAWFYYNSVPLVPTVKSMIAEQLKGIGINEQSTEIFGYVINSEFILNQIPSFLFLVLLLCLAFGLILDRKFAMLCGVPFEKAANHMKLLDFKMPDLLIWVVMASFALSFYKLPHQVWANYLALNVFNALMGLYFFQGLAVLEMSFWFFRIGNFMRFIIYFLIVGQLFFLLSVVGVIDYWVDFRGRMKKARTSSSIAN